MEDRAQEIIDVWSPELDDMRNSDVNWPQCDFKPLDFFFCGNLKSQVCANKTATVH